MTSSREASSAILRARGNQCAVRQGHGPQQSRLRSISGAACVRSHRLIERRFDVALLDVARAEETGRRTLERPGFGAATLRIHDQFDVWISPVDLAQGSADGDFVVEIIER